MLEMYIKCPGIFRGIFDFLKAEMKKWLRIETKWVADIL
jgi:hypothetical protein